MRTLNIAISDLEYEKFGLRQEQLSFSDFVELVSRELSRRNLAKCVELAARHGLHTLTIDGLTAEVRAVQDEAPHHRHAR